jgi:hypothetical protein
VSMLSIFCLRVKGLALKRKSTCSQGDFPTTCRIVNWKDEGNVSTPFGILLGHMMCKHGLLVDPAKIVVIVNLPPPNSVRQLRETLEHIGY